MDNTANSSSSSLTNHFPRILIIDDDPDILDLAQLIFESITGREVLTACGGEEGFILFKLFEPDHFDIITLDLNMPDLDGVKLLRMLADSHFTGAVAFLSAADVSVLESVDQLARAFQLRNLGYISKPFDKQKLEQLINAYLKLKKDETFAEQTIVSIKEMTDGLLANEFSIAYQPKICTKTKRFLAVEALCRWRHPEKGLISPDSFISAAEENGFINQLTNFVVKTTLMEVKKLQDLVDNTIEVSINISTFDLGDLDFPDFLENAAQETKFSPSMILLELTEDRLYNSKNMKSAREILTRIKLLGMKLSIDEYIPNLSPMDKLKSLPFSEVKFSKSLVGNLPNDDDAKEIVMNNVALCKKIQLKTVAQCVESKEEWDFLANAGCDMIQGFYIAKPIAIGELIAWAKAWQAVMFDAEMS